ncbi:unnamed protein product [Adineta steineri]|uniref:Uncharacterized protein n=1 Tax=Adineta steineri TaxID=433720 RepID=A0A814R5C2_9BILA|nr:unnamed protein product [Adineta steineri]
MDMPPIHMCVFLSHEHQQLKAKISELKNNIIHLEQIIAKKNLNKKHSTSISCQTDIIIQHHSILPKPVRSSSDEENHLHRLVNAQNELLKKYENEGIYKRQQQLQVLPQCTLIDDYERRLVHCQKEKEQAERRAISAQKRMTKLEGRYENMRQKMNIFDDGFFEEVNDLKFALQQATSLSQEYEKTIQMLSARLGITYPIKDS